MSHDRLERLRKLNRKRFKRHTGIYPETFAEMELVLDQRERSKKKSGRPPALNASEQLLLTLEFWREYRTFAHLGHDWNIHETTVQRLSSIHISEPTRQVALSSAILCLKNKTTVDTYYSTSSQHIRTLLTGLYIFVIRKI
ncbi:helix-turn-helix domain-containing protein [Deinococcus sp. ME38]|uniref:helix-turn-helix domain-containing protein n=1 Tax=Deinococcus sp. ME38 TaxID=3400344 RepID=UPI003B5BADF4